MQLNYFVKVWTPLFHISFTAKHITNTRFSLCPDSHFRTDNSGIVPCKVRILTLSTNLGILTLRRAIPELSRFSLCAEHIHGKNVDYVKSINERIKHLAAFVHVTWNTMNTYT